MLSDSETRAYGNLTRRRRREFTRLSVTINRVKLWQSHRDGRSQTVSELKNLNSVLDSEPESLSSSESAVTRDSGGLHDESTQLSHMSPTRTGTDRAVR